MWKELMTIIGRWLLLAANPATVNDLLIELDDLCARAEAICEVTTAEIDSIEDQIDRLNAKADVAAVERDRARDLGFNIFRMNNEV